MKKYAPDNKPKGRRVVSCCYLDDWTMRSWSSLSSGVWPSTGPVIVQHDTSCTRQLLITPLWQLDTAHLMNKFLSSWGLQKDCQLARCLHPPKALVTNWGSNSNLSQTKCLFWLTVMTVVLTAHLYKKGDTSPSAFVLKSKADIYLPYTFRITSFCTGILFKPCLSLQGAHQLKTKTSKILRNFPVC